MMLPRPARRILGIASWWALSSQVKLVRIKVSQAFGVDSSKGARKVPPTTLSEHVEALVEGLVAASEEASEGLGITCVEHGAGYVPRRRAPRSWLRSPRAPPRPDRRSPPGRLRRRDRRRLPRRAPAAADHDGPLAVEPRPLLEVSHGLLPVVWLQRSLQRASRSWSTPRVGAISRAQVRSTILPSFEPAAKRS